MITINGFGGRISLSHKRGRDGTTKGADRSGKARDVSTAASEASEERSDRTDPSGRGLSGAVAVM